MSNVKLAIRVRPFTERELRVDKDRTPVVTVVDGNTVTITNIKVSLSGAGDSRERVRRYFADHTFDSACPGTHPAYASQEKVFETIGREVVGSVSRGTSACVLAYGQSATGKTHTMVGTDAQPGLVPRVCRALAEQQPLDVTVSFLEIYNERVHDLLAGDASLPCQSLPRRRGNSRKDLRVREHPSRGPYVQNLRRVAVSDIGALLALVEEGARRRRTAPTRRNCTSSRSHALLELATPHATLHLADLAGSEKASWEGCGGGRQKEGSNINKSLVALSNVISALVSGGIRGRFVPYRDSALTWLLKDCFTGGASTFIIATVSPSAACYGESASTLRWAARARQLPTSKALNCGPSIPTRAALQAQLDQILAELTRHHIRYIHETGKICYDDNHWTLQMNDKNTPLVNASNTEINIGNIMNMFNTKTEVNNSESTASSIASGSSDVINTMDKNIKDEISKEVDKLFGPSLERTRSGGDLEVVAPLRHKKRQYKSQEVLPIDKLHGQNPSMISSTSQSQEKMHEIEGSDKGKAPPIPILYDNQRAEIVASVTERLYTKLKKKEEAAVSRMESMVDRKIMEPLSELRICTNARQRLVELSHRALRNKRRIGIPAHTQTRMTVTRVRDQGIDVQTDLETYVLRKDNCYTFQRDVSTETLPMTPRCKEIAVGPQCGSINFRDRSTITENKQIIRKNTFAMTDIITQCDRCTQTPVAPPPRRKRASNLTKYVTSYDNNRENIEACNVAPVISINISQQYPVESESQSSDESRENDVIKNKPTSVTMTPDLLTNHNTVDTSAPDDNESDEIRNPDNTDIVTIENTSLNQLNLDNPTSSESQVQENEEFPDSEDFTLPRVTVDSSNTSNQEEMKDMILGRNDNMYPYNIVLSPPREIENTKRIVKFKEENMAPSKSAVSQTSWKWENIEICHKENSSDVGTSEKEYETCDKDSHTSSHLDSTDSSNVETTAKWSNDGRKQFGTSSSSLGGGYTSVYKNNSRYKTAKARIYKEFLGLEQNEDGDNRPQFSSLDISSSESTENERFRSRFRERRQFFENKFKRSFDLNENVEKNILDACNSLDRSVNKYERYLTNYHRNERKYSGREAIGRTPTAYLQHLVKLRREVVRADCDTTDSSVDVSRK